MAGHSLIGKVNLKGGVGGVLLPVFAVIFRAAGIGLLDLQRVLEVAFEEYALPIDPEVVFDLDYSGSESLFFLRVQPEHLEQHGPLPSVALFGDPVLEHFQQQFFER